MCDLGINKLYSARLIKSFQDTQIKLRIFFSTKGS